MYFKRVLFFSFTLLFVFVLGCGTGSDSTSSGSADSDEDIIKGAVDDTYYALFSTGVFEDDADANQVSGAVSVLSNEGTVEDNDSIPPWFRRVRRTSRDISVHIEGGTADVSVTTSIEGDFMIDTDGDHEFGSKEIRDRAVRYATFERDYALPGRQWRLIEISPVEINIQDKENRTISIKSIKAYVESELRWEVDDSATMFKVPSELPYFTPGEVVVVTAEIENLNDDNSERESYVYLHYTTRVHRRGSANHGSRQLMYDDGTHGDENPGDGIFTGTYTIGDAAGYHHAAIDVLDKEMFDDETTQNYNSAAWAIPYLVRR